MAFVETPIETFILIHDKELERWQHIIDEYDIFYNIKPEDLWALDSSKIYVNSIVKEFNDSFLNKISSEIINIRNQIVVQNMGLVHFVANKYKDIKLYTLTYDDLINEGSIGLMKAVDKYKYSDGFKFNTYAYWWVRASMYRLMDRKDKVVFNSSKHHKHVKDRNNPIICYLDNKVTLRSGDEVTFADVLGLKYEDKYDTSDLYIINETIDSHCSNRDKKILLRRLIEEETLEEIGKDFCITRERIRQLQKASIELVRDVLDIQIAI